MSHLTEAKRYTIFKMKQPHYSLSEIGKVISKDKFVISREMNRNCDVCSEQYRSDLAQRKYQKRLKEKNKKIRFTEAVRLAVEPLLQMQYSPEQVSGVLKKQAIHISHKRIYRHIWADKKAKGD